MSDAPRGYVTRPVARRQTRPLHAKRAAVIEAAEAAFTIPDVKQRGSDDENNTRLVDTSHDKIETRRK